MPYPPFKSPLDLQSNCHILLVLMVSVLLLYLLKGDMPNDMGSKNNRTNYNY